MVSQTTVIVVKPNGCCAALSYQSLAAKHNLILKTRIFVRHFFGRYNLQLTDPQVTASSQNMKLHRPDSQRSLCCFPLEKILDPNDPLVILASRIDDLVNACYSDEVRPDCTTRLMIGLLYLKHVFHESDESVVARWIENPYAILLRICRDATRMPNRSFQSQSVAKTLAG